MLIFRPVQLDLFIRQNNTVQIALNMHSTIISEIFIKQYDVFSRIRNTFLSPGKPNEQGRRDLLSELEILKSLPAHNHVIQLLACVTESGIAKICFFFVTRCILHPSYNFIKFHLGRCKSNYYKPPRPNAH